MIRAFVGLAGILVLSACAESTTHSPAASVAGSSAATATDPTAPAMAQLQSAEAQRAARQQANFDAAMASANDYADKQRKAQADAEAARKKVCDDTRENRVSHAKDVIIARLDAETRGLANAKAIRSSCRLKERATGAVNVTSSGTGWRVSPEMADDVQCGALPKGITKQDAWVVLARDRDGLKGPSGPILQQEDASPEDYQCTAYDRRVGLDFSSVTFDDLSSVEKLRTWKAP